MSIIIRSSLLDGRRGKNGSAILAVLAVLALLILIVVFMLHSLRIERSTSASTATREQALLAAESGVASASELLMQATAEKPAYLVGLAGEDTNLEIAPCLVVGSTNLTNKNQIAPIFSHDPAETAAFPKLEQGTLQELLEKRLSTNPNETVDLNDPELAGHSDDGGTRGGIIAATGHYPALWEKLKDGEGKVVGRYAFVLTDESDRLNPLLHHGNPRNHPEDWDHGPGDLPLTNGTHSLFSTQEAESLGKIAENLPTAGSFQEAFSTREKYDAKRSLLTRDPCLTPDLIPEGLPEGGKPKYNLNDLATNPAWGVTPYERAEKIAAIIDKNLPKFKERDPSLAGKKGEDQSLYLRRLACSIVDYISPKPGPTGPPDGEPWGSDRVPLVTQIAERCRRTALTSNSVTIESQFFVEVWNPTTHAIPSGGVARIFIGNRAHLLFGDGLAAPFSNYDQTASAVSRPIRPNEFLVIPFAPESQTWTSPDAVTNAPKWEKGPAGNNDTLHHQSFEFFWNQRLVDMTRLPKSWDDPVAGGLNHLGQTLQDETPRWQCMTIPTWSANSGAEDEPDTADEALNTGLYRFVGDPRATWLSTYKWNTVTNYPTKTLWNGISQAGILGRGYVMDPAATWTRRDRVPVNPCNGIPPSSDAETPDFIPSPYRDNGKGSEAPFVIRKGPMLSLGELGNIFDPAQVDDQLKAPLLGKPASRFWCGGGRTLRIGQPEFTDFDTTADWDKPGRRAIELLDLFTVSDPGRQPETNAPATDCGVPGRININTAPHPVLTALFNGITVCSDSRYTNATITPLGADKLATLLEENRPYSRLSDLRLLTPELCNADTFSPPLGKNVPGIHPEVADVFDRAREEAFGKIIGHCTLQTRVFHLFVIGESLDRPNHTASRVILEALLRLAPDATGKLIPSLQDVQWH